MPIDMVNRFAVTDLECTFSVSGSVVCLATNCPDLLSRIANLAPECVAADVFGVDCSWRIVTEPETDGVVESVTLGSRYVTDDGMSFVTLGPLSFLAYDARTRRGISFISESLIRKSTLFTEAFLPSFLSLLPEGKR